MNTNGMNVGGYPNPYYNTANAQTPYYGYGQVQTPYIPPTQVSRPQPVQQNSPTTNGYISGRTVARPEEITPQEIPMDGTVSFFPQNDQTCIYAKSWNADGTIKTIRYIPEIEDPIVPVGTTPNMSDVLKDITERLDRIEKNTSYRKKSYNPNKNQHQSVNQGTEDSNV